MKYPKAMHHPNFIAGSVRAVQGHDPNSGRGFVDHQGTPDVLPPVTVENEDQEAEYRSRGYLLADEQPVLPSYSEFPKWLNHPKRDAVLVNSKDEEEDRLAEGYKSAGKPDPEAVATAAASPHVPGRVKQEYPKMVNGHVVDPSATNGFQKYPMWVDGVLVNNEAEERVARKITLAANDPVKPATASESAPASDTPKKLSAKESAQARGRKAYETRLRNAKAKQTEPNRPAP